MSTALPCCLPTCTRCAATTTTARILGLGLVHKLFAGLGRTYLGPRQPQRQDPPQQISIVDMLPCCSTRRDVSHALSILIHRSSSPLFPWCLADPDPLWLFLGGATKGIVHRLAASWFLAGPLLSPSVSVSPLSHYPTMAAPVCLLPVPGKLHKGHGFRPSSALFFFIHSLIKELGQSFVLLSFSHHSFTLFNQTLFNSIYPSGFIPSSSF